MKHIRNIAAILIIEFLICYACGAFVSATFDLSDIGYEIRKGIVLSFVALGSLTLVLYGDCKPKDVDNK